ncbi:MAG: hypothetical protein Q7V62_04915 [Actinomycetota bacterium]|nr:hypothetical protein [Actinomycetota bacterium]
MSLLYSFALLSACYYVALAVHVALLSYKRTGTDPTCAGCPRTQAASMCLGAALLWPVLIFVAPPPEKRE